MDLSEYQGAIHFHTNYSDGGGTMAEAVDAARRTGLDFIVPSDHDTVRPRRDGWDGWRDHVLVASAAEVSPPNGVHMLTFGARSVRGYGWLTDREVVARLAARRLVTFVAHPQGRPKGPGRVGAWHDWDCPLARGFELWSYLHDWYDKVRPWNVPQVVRHPTRWLTGPSRAVLRQWDQACQTRRLAALAGLDNHNRRYLFGLLRVFPYETLFRALRTHVLCARWSGTATHDVPALVDALAQGRAFVALDELADSRGFRFHADGPDNRVHMGQQRVFQPGYRLHVHLPRPAVVVLLKDGQPIDRQQTGEAEWPVAVPGVYRVEARLDGRPWIYSNPVYLRDATFSSQDTHA